MPAKRRVIVGWRQVPLTKVRVRPARGTPAPRVPGTEPLPRAPDPATEKDGVGE